MLKYKFYTMLLTTLICFNINSSSNIIMPEKCRAASNALAFLGCTAIIAGIANTTYQFKNSPAYLYNREEEAKMYLQLSFLDSLKYGWNYLKTPEGKVHNAQQARDFFTLFLSCLAGSALIASSAIVSYEFNK